MDKDGTGRDIIVVDGIFRFRGIPTDVFEPIARTLKTLRWMIPSWVDHINVHFNTDKTNGEYNAEVTTEYAYRWASVLIYASWLLGSEEDRLDDLSHEFYHILTAPLADFTRAFLKEFVDGEDPAGRLLVKEHTDRVESVVQDLCYTHREARKWQDH